MKSFLLAIISSIVFFSLNTFSQEVIETDWLTASPGSTGSLFGAEVIDVNEGEEGLTSVDVRIPVDELEDYETVVVIGHPKERGQSPKEELIRLVELPSLLHDDLNEPYGIRFFVRGIPGFEFRLQMRVMDDIRELEEK